jgi:hypothetical protein
MSKRLKSRVPAQATSSQSSQPELRALAQLISNLTVTRSADYRTIYSNVFRTRVGNGDVTVIFSRLTHNPSITAAGDVIEEQVEIVMTWSQLKMFAQALRTLVDVIDQEVGEIEIPSNFRLNPEAQRSAIRTLGYRSPAKKS